MRLTGGVPLEVAGTVTALPALGSILESVVGRAASPPPDGEPLRVICFGAHPDDFEIRAGGCAIRWAAQGHRVKIVSLTNGDIGHWQMGGGALALRRRDEAQRAAAALGCETLVLDNHDGELLPTLENRRAVTRLIREWAADVVITHRPNDYHPDHRYAGVVVQDSAHLVSVPFFCPDTPHLRKNPVYLYAEDRFTRPAPFTADIAVALDEVIERKLDALAAFESQFYEGGVDGSPGLVPADPEGQAARRTLIRERFANRFAGTAQRFREALIEWYGPEQGGTVRYAEAFEVCEYGRRPDREELRRLFPFFPVSA